MCSFPKPIYAQNIIIFFTFLCTSLLTFSGYLISCIIYRCNLGSSSDSRFICTTSIQTSFVKLMFRQIPQLPKMRLYILNSCNLWIFCFQQIFKATLWYFLKTWTNRLIRIWKYVFLVRLEQPRVHLLVPTQM